MIAKDTDAFVECVGKWKECTRPDGCQTQNGFFPDRACTMLEITMDFPTCWNGKIDSKDHISHVKYPREDDSCPTSHPKRIPLVSISVHIKDYDGGWHTFSDGTGEFHADYLSGWNVSLLQRAINACQKDVERCPKMVSSATPITSRNTTNF